MGTIFSKNTQQIHIALIISCLIIVVFPVKGQEEHKERQEEHVHRKHRLTIGMGHAHIPTGIRAGDGKRSWLNLGAFAFDYDFYFHPKWAVGLHSDIVPTQYEVEFTLSKDDEIVTRTSPLSSVLVGSYKITEHLGVQLGFGVEYTKEESLGVLRLGVEYGWELPQDWELGIGATYDDKIDAYSTWFLGFMLSKWLGKPHE